MNAVLDTLASVPITDATAVDIAHLSSGSMVRELGLSIETVAQRAPALDDLARWRRHAIDGREYTFAQPITFTPYAAARPCSARCRFCSENLRDAAGASSSSTLRPGARYFEHLRNGLRALEGLPIGYSLSGLETTDDAAWLFGMLEVLQSHAQRSPVTERVLYTNAAGFVGEHGDALAQRFVDFQLSWTEVSRHHFDAHINQRIMRFREGIAAQEQSAFEHAVRKLGQSIPVKLVCIVQTGGVDSAVAVTRYLDWAHTLGVSAVIIREFSQLPARYAVNGTARYIRAHRIAMADLLRQIAHQPELSTRLRFHRATEGYYFWNVMARDGALDVIFEASDYERMHAMHDSNRVYKLVLHTNGNLCGGWDPQRQVLLNASARP